MLIRVEKGSAVPISRQIADQLRAQCLSGRLTAGAQIPSVVSSPANWTSIRTRCFVSTNA